MRLVPEQLWIGNIDGKVVRAVVVPGNPLPDDIVIEQQSGLAALGESIWLPVEWDKSPIYSAALRLLRKEGILYVMLPSDVPNVAVENTEGLNG